MNSNELRKLFLCLANPLVIRFLRGIKLGYKYAGKKNKEFLIRDWMFDVQESNYVRIKDQMLKNGIIERIGSNSDCYFQIKKIECIKWSKIL